MALTQLHNSAGLRSMLYLAGAVAIVEGIGGLLERVSIADPAHTVCVPCGWYGLDVHTLMG